MKYTIICDESSTKLRHLVLGSLIVLSHNHPLLSKEFLDWKKAHNFNIESEFKWSKVSRRYLSHYKAIVDWFVEHLRANHLRFRAHVVDTGRKAYREYGNGDLEKAFYKVYYHLLINAVKRLAIHEEGSKVMILLDDKTNRYPFRLNVIKKALNRALKRDLELDNLIANVEPRRSSGARGEILIQVVDILIGAIAFIRNGWYRRAKASSPKLELVKYIESRANTSLLYDTNVQSPFNIWTFDIEKSIAAKRIRELRKKKQPAIGKEGKSKKSKTAL